jgi:nicotinamide N-methyltransferase
MSDIEDAVDLFQEPAEFYKPPPEPSFETYSRKAECVESDEPKEVKVRLVGKSPLWGHLLWNAGIVTTEFIDQNKEKYIKDKTVLELGAAAALPSLVAALSADNVVITDYPDPDLMDNINYNVEMLKNSTPKPLSVTTEGYIWGNDVSNLLNAKGQNGRKFDFIILADLIFNHSEHSKLIKTCDECLTPNGKILVVFTHHRPRFADRDLQFFEDAQSQANFKSTKIIEEKRFPMFEKDEGSEFVRSMVHGYLVERQ